MCIRDSGGTERLSITEAERELVCITIDARGVQIHARTPRLAITAEEEIAIAGRRVTIAARDRLALQVGGDLDVQVGGTRTALVAGDDRTEAAAIQLQARDAHVEVRAQGSVRLDGDHIGLNDTHCPVPFPWSGAARALAVAEEK